MSYQEENAVKAEAFLRANAVVLKRYLIGHGIAADVADESITDTFLVIVRTWKRVETRDNPEAWTRKIALRIARRKQQRRSSWEARHATLAEAVSGNEDIAARIVNRETLFQAIRNLPEKQRITIYLRYFAEFGVAQIAEILGVSQGTVMSNTSDGLRNLRRQLDEGNVDDKREGR